MYKAITISKPREKYQFRFFSWYEWTITTVVASAKLIYKAISTVIAMAISLTIAIASDKTIAKSTAAGKIVTKV